MSTEEFARLGVMVTAFTAYVLSTGVVGVFMSFASEDSEWFCLAAWLTGAIVFTVTVTIMKG